jgi:hypothetical protein
MTKLEKRALPVRGTDDYVSASTTISTIWTAKGDELLPPERGTPLSTLPTPDADLSLIDESHPRPSRERDSGTLSGLDGIDADLATISATLVAHLSVNQSK